MAIVVLHSLSRVLTLCNPMDTACQASLSFTLSQSLLKILSIEPVMPFNHLVLCHPPLLLPSIFPSIRVFSSESALHIRWPKYWSFSLCIRPSSECSRLISFRIDWFDLLGFQGTLKIFSSAILQKHQFFGAQPSLHPCISYLCPFALFFSNGEITICRPCFGQFSCFLCGPHNNSTKLVSFLLCYRLGS